MEFSHFMKIVHNKCTIYFCLSNFKKIYIAQLLLLNI